MTIPTNFPSKVREQFFNSVIGPIGHFVVAQHIDGITTEFNKTLQDRSQLSADFDELARILLSSPSQVLDAIISGMIIAHRGISKDITSPYKFPFTAEQVNAAISFLELVGSDGGVVEINGEQYFTTSQNFHNDNVSVLFATQLIASRTNGITLGSIDDLVALTETPGFNNLIRLLMSGAEDFDFGLNEWGRLTRKISATPKIIDFNNQHTYIAELIDGKIVPNPALIRLAADHRKERREMPNKDVTDKRYSTGCPVKKVKFHRRPSSLEEYGLSLTDDQMEILMSGENPVVVKADVNPSDGEVYDVRRDVVSAFVSLNRQVLRALGPQLVAVAEAFPATHLQHNLRLIGVGVDLHAGHSVKDRALL